MNTSVNPYVSVDCVILGFDGESLKVLLVRQRDVAGEHATSRFKLPGSLIGMEEDLDSAARRVLYELTGLKMASLTQFKAFGSVDRLADKEDTVWLERFHKLDKHLERIVTVAYLSLVRINTHSMHLNEAYEACWMPVNDIQRLAFDHNDIVAEAVLAVRNISRLDKVQLFNLLPKKFTVAQLRVLLEVVSGEKYDIRNFHKRIQNMPYVVPLDEKETGVSHRAARYFKFDRKIYNKMFS